MKNLFVIQNLLPTNFFYFKVILLQNNKNITETISWLLKNQIVRFTIGGVRGECWVGEGWGVGLNFKDKKLNNLKEPSFNSWFLK